MQPSGEEEKALSDFEDKLNAILSNPEAMAQVMGLAQSLSGSGAFGGAQEQEHSAPPPKESAGRKEDPLGGLGNIAELFSQIDPKLIERLLPLVGEFSSSGNDERTQLLYALRPFLKPERRDKVERAVKAAKLIHIGKKFLTSMGEPYV